jgi:3-oxoacyl-[acyl-carrier protein] reductase
MLSDNDLAGKIALVTGGSRGIGRQVSIALARQGADIAVNYLERDKEAGKVLSEVEECGSRCITIRADVSKSSEVARMMDIIRNRLGVVQILINNAGIAKPQPIHDISEKNWDEIIDTNIKSAFLVTQTVLRESVKKAGVV